MRARVLTHVAALQRRIDRQLADETRSHFIRMLVTTARAIHDFMPWGSGLGSFRGVYHLYESRDQITTTYVNHAHDDYIEIALELGVAGVLLTILFPDGIPAREEVIRATGGWLDEAERLSQVR